MNCQVAVSQVETQVRKEEGEKGLKIYNIHLLELGQPISRRYLRTQNFCFASVGESVIIAKRKYVI